MTNAIGRWLATAIASRALVTLSLRSARATIIDDWASMKAPPPPALQSVSVDPATTALLLLDFVKQTCSVPRCTAVVPAVTAMLQAARAHRFLVVYSVTLASTVADILPPLAPLSSDAAVQATPTNSSTQICSKSSRNSGSKNGDRRRHGRKWGGPLHG